MGGGARAPSFSISVLDGDEWSASRLGSFNPVEIAFGTHWIGGWMCPGADMDAMDCLCRESNSSP
jgi:hypothetical protein